MIFWIFFLILSLIVEVYLWWQLQASLIFLSGRTCTIGGWLNTVLPHCMYNVHTHYSSQKLNSKICNVSEEFSSAHRAWIYFIQNTAKAVILGNILLFKKLLSIWICNWFVWSKLNVQHHYSSVHSSAIPRLLIARTCSHSSALLNTRFSLTLIVRSTVTRPSVH